jgi:hypothetical protein
MGGTENYRKAFFTQSYLDANPQNAALVADLQKSLGNQIEILDLGCIVHGQYCPGNLKPLQGRLEEQLKTMKEKAKTKVAEEEPGRTMSVGSQKAEPAVGDKPKQRSSHRAANPKNPFAAAKAKAAAQASGATAPKNEKNPFGDSDSDSTDDDDDEKLPAPPRDSLLPPLPGLVKPAASGGDAAQANPRNPFAGDDDSDDESSDDDDDDDNGGSGGGQDTAALRRLSQSPPGSRRGSRPTSRPTSRSTSRSSSPMPGGSQSTTSPTPPVAVRPKNPFSPTKPPAAAPEGQSPPPVPKTAKPKKTKNPFQKGDSSNPFKKTGE